TGSQPAHRYVPDARWRYGPRRRALFPGPRKCLGNLDRTLDRPGARGDGGPSLVDGRRAAFHHGTGLARRSDGASGPHRGLAGRGLRHRAAGSRNGIIVVPAFAGTTLLLLSLMCPTPTPRSPAPHSRTPR